MSYQFLDFRSLQFALCISVELSRMAETDDFHAEDQLNYEAETGEGGEGEGDEADIGDDPELEAIKVFFPGKYLKTDTIFMFPGESESYGGRE